jgi:hypothetical protein
MFEVSSLPILGFVSSLICLLFGTLLLPTQVELAAGFLVLSATTGTVNSFFNVKSKKKEKIKPYSK